MNASEVPTRIADASADRALVAEVCRLVADRPGDPTQLVDDGIRRIAPLHTPAERAALARQALAHLVGLGELELLLADDTVDEVLVNAGGDTWVDRAGSLERMGDLAPERLAHLVERLLAPLGRRVDRASPIVDARLPDGSRVCVALPPVAVDGAALSIRRFSRRTLGLEAFGDDDVDGPAQVVPDRRERPRRAHPRDERPLRHRDRPAPRAEFGQVRRWADRARTGPHPRPRRHRGAGRSNGQGTAVTAAAASVAVATLVVLATALAPRPRTRRPSATARPVHSPRMLRSGRLTVPSIRRSPRQPAPREVAAWCDALARDLRSGATLTEALTRVLPADAATARATAALRFALERGVSTPIALTRVERPGEHLHLAMVVLGTVARSGGPAASAVDAAAATLRQRAHDVDGRTVQASQARLSAHVMTAVPILMLAVLASTDPEIRSTMATPVGAGALAAGLVLNVTGWWWMRRIVGGAA